jgi:hypothetical protein
MSENIKYDLDNIFGQILLRNENQNKNTNGSYTFEMLNLDAKYMVRMFIKLINIETELRKLGSFVINQTERLKSDLLMIQYSHFFMQLLKNLVSNDKFYGRPDLSENLTTFNSIYRDIVNILTKRKSNNAALLKSDLNLHEHFGYI